MRKILDKMFGNKRLAIAIPIALAAVLYLLFALFGEDVQKNSILIVTPLASVFVFFAVFFVFIFNIKATKFSQRFFDFCELFAVFFFCSFALFGTISFVVSGFQNFSPIYCACTVVYSSVAWAHSKRQRQSEDK